MKKPRAPKLTDLQDHTIRVALIGRFSVAMEHLNMCAESGFWLVVAGESWDAYKAFAGYPIWAQS